MDYKDMNRIESIIKSCCVGGDEKDSSTLDAASLIADTIDNYLDGKWISAADWTIICCNIQSGLANAASRAIRILASSKNLNLITDKE